MCETLCDFVLDPGDQQFGGIEPLGDRLLQQRGEMRHMLARFDDDTVACSEAAGLILLPHAGDLWNFWQVQGKPAGIRAPDCHKVEKNLPSALSKAGSGWYIPLAPDGLGPGLPSKGAFGTGEASHASRVGLDPSSPAFSRRRAMV